MPPSETKSPRSRNHVTDFGQARIALGFRRRGEAGLVRRNRSDRGAETQTSSRQSCPPDARAHASGKCARRGPQEYLSSVRPGFSGAADFAGRRPRRGKDLKAAAMWVRDAPSTAGQARDGDSSRNVPSQRRRAILSPPTRSTNPQTTPGLRSRPCPRPAITWPSLRPRGKSMPSATASFKSTPSAHLLALAAARVRGRYRADRHFGCREHLA